MARAAVDGEPEWIYFKPPAIDWNDEESIQEWAQQVWEYLKAERDGSDDSDDQ